MQPQAQAHLQAAPSQRPGELLKPCAHLFAEAVLRWPRRSIEAGNPVRQNLSQPSAAPHHRRCRHDLTQHAEDHDHRVPSQQAHQRQRQKIELTCLSQIGQKVASHQRRRPARHGPRPASLRHPQQADHPDQFPTPADGLAVQPLGPFVEKRLAALVERLTHDLLGGQAGTRVRRRLTTTLRADEHAVRIAFFEGAPFQHALPFVPIHSGFDFAYSKRGLQGIPIADAIHAAGATSKRPAFMRRCR